MSVHKQHTTTKIYNNAYFDKSISKKFREKIYNEIKIFIFKWRDVSNFWLKTKIQLLCSKIKNSKQNKNNFQKLKGH